MSAEPWRDVSVLVCGCTHSETAHNVSTDGSRRTACSITTGSTGTPCSCRRFEPTYRRVFEYRTRTELLT